MQQENLVGTTLGQYQILDELGRGGMAVVYKAWQPSLRRYVALKVLLPYLGGDPEFIQRFQQEAIVAANLSHPHIVTIYEVGQQDGRIFIAMEYVEGRSLEQLILDQGGVPLDRTVRVLRQVAEALDYAHKRRFLHRDIKPANILLADDDRVVITDFGIAKAMEGSGATARLTSAGTVLGTPAYMSPEQIQGLAIDYRSDLYALGIVAYEMLSGQVPFDGTTTALLYAQVNNPPPAITRFAPGLPSHVEWVVARMLAKQPDERFVSAGEFVEALAGVNGAAAQAPAYGVPASPPLPTPAARGGTAVMPPGAQLPQPYGAPAYAQPAAPASPPSYGTIPASPPAGGPPSPYSYPATQAAAAPAPAYGYAPQASGWVQPVQAKKKRAVWPWLVGGGMFLVIVAVAAVLGYFFLGRMAVTRLLEEGDTALAAQDYAAAQTAFEAALEKDAENAAAHRGLGWVQYEVGQYEEAVAQFSKAVELEPANPDGYEGQGRSLYALARYEDALAVSKLWEEVEPDDVQKESLVCQASYQLGYYEEAVSSCKNWAAKEPQNALAHVSLGWAHLEAKRNQEAIQSFSRSLELAETDDGFLGLCEALSSLGDQKGVVASAQRWIAYNPRNADAHIYLGWASYQLKDYPEAVEAFSSSLAIEENSEAHHGLGDSFYAQKDYDSALKSYEKWLVLEPENALAYALLGWVQYSMNNTEDALRSFARALEMGPIASAYRGLGSVYYAQAEYELALENQEQWVDLEPNSAAARGSLGWTLQKLKRHADAASSFQRAVELFPTTDYYSGLWTSLRAIPDAQKALSAAEQWTEFDSDDARPFAALGWTYVDLNDCANARSNFQKALELDPQSESAKSGLDRCP